MEDIWPPMEAYTLAHRCPRCRAEPGEPCTYRGPLDYNPGYDNPTWRRGPDSAHKARSDAGIRHYTRDVGRAPWPEDREPGRRYDSLGDLWNPERLA